jgi:hypothetical protein
VVAIVAATLVVGAAVQGLVGLGLALVTSPVIMMVQPSLMPDLMLWLAVLLPLITLTGERADIDWRGLRWSLSARVPGTVVGVYLVATLSESALGVAVGTMVLLSVLLTIRAVRIPVNRATLAGAGFASGIAGTATAIGGPPMAVLMQHRQPRQIRTTLAVFFVAGAALSLTGLGLSGSLDVEVMVLALLLTPSLFAGFALSRGLARRLPRDRVRAAVLAVCGTSATVLLVRSLW